MSPHITFTIILNEPVLHQGNSTQVSVSVQVLADVLRGQDWVDETVETIASTAIPVVRCCQLATATAAQTPVSWNHLLVEECSHSHCAQP